MTRTPHDAAAWMEAGPARTINGGDWEGGCVAAVDNAGAFAHPYPFAVAAAVAAGATYRGGASAPGNGTLNPNPNAAGDGSVHCWGGIWNVQFKRWDGHIGFQYGGQIYMASVYARRQFGHHLGSSTWAEYDADRGLPYLGHSPYFGDQPFDGVNPASLNTRTLDDSQVTQQQEETMPHSRGIVYEIVGDNGGINGVKLVIGDDLTVLPNDSVATIYASVLNHGLDAFPDFKGDGQPIPINKQNADWIAAGYGPQIPGGTIAYLWNQASKAGQPATYVPTVAAQLDQGALSASITAAVQTGLRGVQSPTPAAIAAAVKVAFGQALSS